MLSSGSLEEAEAEEGEAETPEEELESTILAEMEKRGRLPNLSTFAFTATPKPKTLELFGTKRADGKFEPFHLYSMRQAIEEGFILDVLANYTTYKAYWRLLKKVEDDPRYDKKKAAVPAQVVRRAAPARDRREGADHGRALRRAGAGRDRRQGQGDDRHPLAPARGALQAGGRQVPRRARLSVQGACGLLGHGRGRRSVVHRVRHERLPGGADRQDLRAAGVPLPDRRQQVPDRLRPAAAAHDVRGQEARRRERGADPIAAQPHASGEEGHDGARLRQRGGRDQGCLRALLRDDAAIRGDRPEPALRDSERGSRASRSTPKPTCKAFAKVYFDPKATQDRLYAVLAPVVERFKALSQEEQHDFRGQLTDYVRLYAFLAQVLTFADADLEKLYVFARHLRRLLPADRAELPREVQQNIDMESYRIQQTGSGKIALERRPGVLDPVSTKSGYGVAPEELETLSRIIAELNERFGLNLGPEHRVTLGQMMEKLDDDAALDAAARVNTRENVRLTFDQKVEHVIQEIVDSNFELYKRITDDRAFGEAIKNFLFDQYLRGHRNAEELIKARRIEDARVQIHAAVEPQGRSAGRQGVTHAALKTIAAFLNTDGGDLLIGVADDGAIVGIERDQLESDDKFMRHLTQVVRNGMGDRAGTCIDPKTQIVEGKTVCVVSCQRSPEPVFLKWKGVQGAPEGDFFVRIGPGTRKLSPDSATDYIRTRFGSVASHART